MDIRVAEVTGTETLPWTTGDLFTNHAADLSFTLPTSTTEPASDDSNERDPLSPKHDATFSQDPASLETMNAHSPRNLDLHQSPNERVSTKHAVTAITNQYQGVDAAFARSSGSEQNEKQKPGRLVKAFLSQSSRRLHAFLTDTWWPEMLALAFSSCCLLAIIGLLIHYDNKEIPDFPSGLTLNTIISILGVGSKSALMFAVAATMSQSKWCWFYTPQSDRKRRLEDIQFLDEASRGPLGSLCMLFTQTSLSLAAIGAVIVVLCIAYDPFVQQGISYITTSTNISHEATLRQSIAVPYLYSIPDPATRAVYTGIYSDAVSFQRKPYCPTGNCTWQPFQSVEWCSKCGDVSQELHAMDCNFTLGNAISNLKDNQTEALNCTLSLAAGRTMVTQVNVSTQSTINGNDESTLFVIGMDWSPVTLLYGVPNSDDDSNNSTVSYFQGQHEILGENNPLVSLLFVTFGDVNGGRPANNSTTLPQLLQSTLCVLSPCLRTYNISMANGELSSHVLEEDYGVLNTINEGGLCWRPTSVKNDDIPMEERGGRGVQGNIKSNSSNMAWCNLGSDSLNWAYQIHVPLAGRTSNMLGILPAGTDMYYEVLLGFAYDASDNHVLDTLLGDNQPLPPSEVMAGIADALTYANLHPGPSVYGTPENLVNLVPGTVWGQKVFVRVRWAWFSLPILLNFVAILFLALTAYATRRQHLPLWKSSTLAMLYHGLAEGLVDPNRGYENASDMDSDAKGVHVRLDSSEGTGRLHLRG